MGVCETSSSSSTSTSTSLLLGSDWDGRCFGELICRRDSKKCASEPFTREEEVRGGPLKMILKDGSKVDFLASGVNLDVDAREGEEEERLVHVNDLALEGLTRISIMLEDGFNKLTSLSKFMGLLVDAFEEEILVLLRRLELSEKRKVMRSRLKKSLLVGSKFEKVLRKLEYFVNYKSGTADGRRVGKRNWDFAKVYQ